MRLGFWGYALYKNMINTKLTILIAEDEEDLREMYSRALLQKGFIVIPATNGKEALEILEAEYSHIDLILLDIVMPGMDGMEFLKAIQGKKEYEKIAILVSTNLDNEADRKEALRLGAHNYFIKSSHTPAELVKMIQDICFPVIQKII